MDLLLTNLKQLSFIHFVIIARTKARLEKGRMELKPVLQ